MWYEYPIPANPQKQREIIRKLRKWIENLETRGIIRGFAFNHYSTPETLNVRFDCVDKENLKTVRKELEQEVKKMLPNYVLEERLWDAGKTPEHVLKAYELGSRCAFLFWELAEKGRFLEEFTSSFVEWSESGYDVPNYSVPLLFQYCFSHGVMNSLGISKQPNEQLIHLALLIESTRSSSPQELCRWIEKQPKQFFKWFCPPKNCM